MDFLFFLLIGLVAGWLAGKLWRGSGFGLIGDLIVGVIGALLGGWLFGRLGIALPIPDLVAALITATVGALAAALPVAAGAWRNEPRTTVAGLPGGGRTPWCVAVSSPGD